MAVWQSPQQRQECLGVSSRCRFPSGVSLGVMPALVVSGKYGLVQDINWAFRYTQKGSLTS